MLSSLKRIAPPFIWRHLDRLVGSLCALPSGIAISLAARPTHRGIYVFYGHNHVPRLVEKADGGIVKFQHMQEVFPNSPRQFNILYMVSSRMPKGAVQILWFARQKGVRFVWNQNGVAYPAWHGPGWENTNAPMAKLLHAADYVFYQSEFCKQSADRYLGEREGPGEILYNAVDTNKFTPAESDPDPRSLVLLLGGRQNYYYRFSTAVETLAIVARTHPAARLLVTGRLRWIPDETEASCRARNLVAKLGVKDRVIFMGPYAQADAPSIFRQAHILLHTQYNDACPGLVVEAMACGLPIVYSHSGGVPELVGPGAGVGVASELSWEREIPPDPEALAQAVLQVAERRKQFAHAARQRAVEKFDLRPWLRRHREVFEQLLC